jgi:hypothetical protein
MSSTDAARTIRHSWIMHGAARRSANSSLTQGRPWTAHTAVMVHQRPG